jgi:hypothetical protein
MVQDKTKWMQFYHTGIGLGWHALPCGKCKTVWVKNQSRLVQLAQTVAKYL